MHEGDGHAALAYRSGDALDGTEADVSAGEDARDARLQEERVPVELPPSGDADVGAGEHVALRVEGDLGREPGGRGVGTDEDEQPARLAPGRLAGRGVADVDRLQRGVAMRRDHLGAVLHVDVRASGELLDEIARHALLERLAAAEDRHAPGVGREEHRCLAG